MNDNKCMHENDKQNRLSSIIFSTISAIISLAIAIFLFYLSKTGTFWFIPLGIIFIVDLIFIIIPLFIKDDYQAMRISGIYQIISVILVMPYLLFMVLWNDANNVLDYSFFTYGIISALAALKLLIALISRLIMRNKYQPLLHASSNNAFITVFYLGILVELIVINQFYPGNSTAIFDNLLKEKPLWTYIISISVNAISTTVVALLALSTDIRAKTQEELSTKGKIKHTIKWFNDNEVNMFFSLIFTLYLAVLSLINMKQSFFYILLFVYYIGTAAIRLINYIWHRKILKITRDNQIKENRLSSWILLFDAGAYLIFSNVLVVGAIFMMIQKANAGTNIYLFLFFIIPMAVMRLVTANKNIKRNRKDNNTYKLGLSLISLVSIFFTILEILAISCHQLGTVFRFVIIIGAIIAVKIAVIVVAIIFVVHWLRSIILNRKSKERTYFENKDTY